jgi:type I restriction enzyme S subunit
MKVVAYPTCELGDVAELYDSLHQTPTYANEGYPMIRVTDIRRGFLDTTNAMKVTQEVYEQFAKKHKPQIGDILFSRVGSYGNSTFVDKRVAFCLGQNTVCISPDRQKIQPTFLYGALNSDDLFHQIRSYVSGASQGTISLKNIRKLQVPVPPLPVQQRIAGILAAYDELIENSQRRIKILEAMARGLYREWFVHFRFPGHENHPRVDSALGEIPEGWAIQKVGDLVEFKKGKKPTAVFESAESGLKRHLLIDALRGGSSLEFVMPDKLISTTVDDTIMVMDGSGSSDVFIGYEGVIGSTLGRYRVVDVSDGGPFWLFLFLDTHLEEIKSKNIGSAIPHANKDFINGMSVAVAPKSVLLNFERAVTPMFGLIRSLRSKTDALRRTRDLLLPRLLSGQIEVGGT